MMIKYNLLLLLLVVLTTTIIFLVNGKFHDRKIFVSKYASKTKSVTLNHLETIQKQSREKAIHSLRSLPSDVQSELVKAAEVAFTSEKYPVKTAIEYLEFSRNGNRKHYENKVTAHQQRINTLVVGNLLDHSANHTSSNKYVDEIVNGIWSLMEESTWCWPAHLSGLQGSHDHLAAPGHLAIDLGAGEIAKFVAWVRLLMAEKFDHVSTVINRRIDHELRQRIFEGFLKTNYGWEGMGGHHSVNNWNIWVNGNILKAALLTLKDMTLFDAVLNKTLYSTDYFLDGYGEDGGCDEGPAYWRHAGGRLIEYLEALEHIFPGAKQYFSGVKLLKLIGEYSYKMHIQDHWFVNFADSNPMLTYPPSLIAMYGKLFNDESMKQYSAYMWHLATQKSVSAYFISTLNDLNEFINGVNWHTEIAKEKAVAPELGLVWMPDIEVLVTRSKSASTGNGKFFLAAKAGTNHESHNHNDVGNLVLFQNGHPVLIDVGVGTYTAKTFGGHRYEIFYMQSQYHNTPTINGVQQKAGGAYTARNVSLKQLPNEGGVVFTADIAGAYPAAAHAKHWTRTVTFDQSSNSVTVEENFELTSFSVPQKLHYMLVREMKVTPTATGVLLTNSATGVKVAMDFDLKVFTFAEDQHSLDGDIRLTQVWGDSVQRLTLTTAADFKQLTGHFKVRFSEKLQ